jgi:hypothetical protein
MYCWGCGIPGFHRNSLCLACCENKSGLAGRASLNREAKVRKPKFPLVERAVERLVEELCSEEDS